MNFENMEWQRTILSHESGSKFYEVMLLIPMKESQGRFGGKELDTAKQALFMTRWGKWKDVLVGGAFGEGKLLDISKSVSGMRVYANKTIENKGARGYFQDENFEETHSVTDIPEIINRRMARIGMLGLKNANFAKFMGQFSNALDGIDETPSIIVPKIEKTRSPLYGSW